jgi:hypothetical protein
MSTLNNESIILLHTASSFVLGFTHMRSTTIFPTYQLPYSTIPPPLFTSLHFTSLTLLLRSPPPLSKIYTAIFKNSMCRCGNKTTGVQPTHSGVLKSGDSGVDCDSGGARHSPQRMLASDQILCSAQVRMHACTVVLEREYKPTTDIIETPFLDTTPSVLVLLGGLSLMGICCFLGHVLWRLWDVCAVLSTYYFHICFPLHG